MLQITFLDNGETQVRVPDGLTKKRRPLTKEEQEILIKNGNYCYNSDWNGVYVPADEGDFDVNLIRSSVFEGFVVLGRLKKAVLKYHDLELHTGIYSSRLKNVVIGDDCVVQNVAYLENYRLERQVILFNIQEMSCTNHSKFGNGILKNGENESSRIWIGVANENDGRKILPFEKMIPADAFLWSRKRDDEQLQKAFVRITENDFSKECNTFGVVEERAVIKNTTLIKDAKIGSCCYIKGAFKIKNVTILSSEDEVTQIGEGVELVNGIAGYGCRIFYQAVAVRFVMGRNCQLKYGGRLLNSVLGDNSTVSCCELLNNLIFPFHEQHHNSSFLIATTVLGQSNIAAGATVGSNHNSRSPDGEILAGRGFWPGLCSDFKHNSRFASFVLAAKGSYHHELDVQYPFSLISPGKCAADPICIVPGWWLMHNMFALARNEYKFARRDKRFKKIQHIEILPIAPDTVQESLLAIERLNHLASEAGVDFKLSEADKAIVFDPLAQKKCGGTVLKVGYGCLLYKKLCVYFAVRSLVEYAPVTNKKSLFTLKEQPLYTEWTNVGGQIMPKLLVEELLERIRLGKVQNWNEVHSFYDEQHELYTAQKARYALYVFEYLTKKELHDFSFDDFTELFAIATSFADEMYKKSVESRSKDFTDYYRNMTYESESEMHAVLGDVAHNDFLTALKEQVSQFKTNAAALLKKIGDAA